VSKPAARAAEAVPSGNSIWSVVMRHFPNVVCEYVGPILRFVFKNVSEELRAKNLGPGFAIKQICTARIELVQAHHNQKAADQ
jgi:hypothetical protein